MSGAEPPRAGDDVHDGAEALFVDLLMTVTSVSGKLAQLRMQDPKHARLIAEQLRSIANQADGGVATPPQTATAEASTTSSVAPAKSASVTSLGRAPHALVEAGDPRTCLYTSKGIAPQVIELLVLRYLELKRGGRCEKTDLYQALSVTEKFRIGSYASFCTRLNDFRRAGWIDWAKNQQNAPISITEKGLARYQQLASRTANGLKADQRSCLAETIAWSGLDREVEVKLSPVARREAQRGRALSAALVVDAAEMVGSKP